MSEHPTDSEIERYAKALLTPGDLLRVDDHVAVCQECRLRAVASVDVSRRLGSTVSAIRRDLALAPEREAKLSNVTRMPVKRPLAWRIGRWGGLGALAASAALAANIIWGTRAPAPAPAAPVAPAPTVAAAPTAAAAPAASPADALTPAEHSRVEAVLAGGQLAHPRVLDTLRSHSGALMGEPARISFAAVSPIGVIVDDDGPSFVWQAFPQRAEYQVAVFDETFEPVAGSGWQTETRWTIERPLARGKSYTWQVTARADGRETTAPAPPQPEARFKVTSVEQHAQLTDLRKRAGESHLALAVLLADAGVLDEAERELTLASAANPPSSSAVKRLQASLSALRR